MSTTSRRWRKPNDAERILLETLVDAAPSLSRVTLDDLVVVEMTDAGMGSLRLGREHKENPDRRFGGQVAEVEFTDADGVLVLAALNVDQSGQPFELDIWKTDFSPLIQLPGRSALRARA
jgi:hypothetical protein